ncbi:MAG: HD domain-containing protein [Candidatus Thorarchaeota archaeon]
MLEEDLLSKVRKFATDNSKNDDIHGFSHTERVYELCIKIGKKLGADLFILKLSALFHDIGRIQEKKIESKGNHAEFSAQMALNFLKRKDIEINEKVINQVIHCIRAHSFSNNIIPETLEAKILSDVDKLDALGAIGLYRTIGFTIKNQGGIDQVIEHLENKILKLKDKLYLDFSKKVADERQKIILDFYNEILKKS